MSFILNVFFIDARRMSTSASASTINKYVYNYFISIVIVIFFALDTSFPKALEIVKAGKNVIIISKPIA